MSLVRVKGWLYSSLLPAPDVLLTWTFALRCLKFRKEATSLKCLLIWAFMILPRHDCVKGSPRDATILSD